MHECDLRRQDGHAHDESNVCGESALSDCGEGMELTGWAVPRHQRRRDAGVLGRRNHFRSYWSHHVRPPRPWTRAALMESVALSRDTQWILRRSLLLLWSDSLKFAPSATTPRFPSTRYVPHPCVGSVLIDHNRRAVSTPTLASRPRRRSKFSSRRSSLPRPRSTLPSPLYLPSPALPPSTTTLNPKRPDS